MTFLKDYARRLLYVTHSKEDNKKKNSCLKITPFQVTNRMVPAIKEEYFFFIEIASFFYYSSLEFSIEMPN